MEVVVSAADLRAAVSASRTARVGFVPTMGALHDGHLSLTARAREESELVCVSIFVNPLQFAPGEDFQRYPRQLERDLGMLAETGVDLVFTPQAAELIPAGASTTVRVDDLTQHLEGASRPGHFDGVTTIVAALLHLVAPWRAYFGEKDFQQLAVVRRMVRDLHFPVEVVGCPIVREPDGLAMSSRNAYLSADERRRALVLSAALAQAAASWTGDAGATRTQLRSTLGAAPGVRLDYAEVVDPETLRPLEGVVDTPAQALVAALVGRTRLIDNIRLERDAVDR